MKEASQLQMQPRPIPRLDPYLKCLGSKCACLGLERSYLGMLTHRAFLSPSDATIAYTHK